jgi:hypothetical protein
VVGARDGSWGGHNLAILRLAAKLSHVAADVDRLACHLHWSMDYGYQARVQSPLTGAIPSHQTTQASTFSNRLSGGCEDPEMGLLMWC